MPKPKIFELRYYMRLLVRAMMKLEGRDFSSASCATNLFLRASTKFITQNTRMRCIPIFGLYA